MRLPVQLALLAVVGTACEPSPRAPVSVMALLNNSAGKLGPKQAQLDTIQNVTGLIGSPITMLGGASIIFDSKDPAQANLASLSDDQLQDALYRSRGQGVHANLIDKGGVLWPADFHSWNMVSTYWNFEQAFLYFQRVYDGEKTDKLAGASVLYWAGYKFADIGDPTKQDVYDNMLYDSRVKAFVITPFNEAQQVPLSMNTGIVGHEFAHRVFNQKAYGGAGQPPVLTRWQGGPLNRLKGVDEGLADFHGYGVTCTAKDGPGCKTTYLAQSFPEELAIPRDFSRSAETCMTVELRTAIVSLGSNDFLGQGQQYKLGTLIAASFYQAANKGGKIEIMEKALIKAYDDSSTVTPGLKQVLDSNLSSPEQFTLEKFTEVVLTHITDPELKRLTCNEMWGRLDLQVPQGAFPPVPTAACPSTSARDTTCPVLPP